nr:MAG TPA: hypothetical protein [Caudoviricetes sp.]
MTKQKRTTWTLESVHSGHIKAPPPGDDGDRVILGCLSSI